jgi:hypothetical protein
MPQARCLQVGADGIFIQWREQPRRRMQAGPQDFDDLLIAPCHDGGRAMGFEFGHVGPLASG